MSRARTPKRPITVADLTGVNLFCFGELAKRIDDAPAGAPLLKVDAVDIHHARRVIEAGLLHATREATTITEAGRAMLATNVDAQRGYNSRRGNR